MPIRPADGGGSRACAQRSHGDASNTPVTHGDRVYCFFGKSGVLALPTGFDHFSGFLGPDVDDFEHTNRNGQVDWQRNGETLHEKGDSTFLLADEAVRLLESRDQQRPFSLQVSFNAPHFPRSAPREFLAKSPDLRGNATTKAAMISDRVENGHGFGSRMV